MVILRPDRHHLIPGDGNLRILPTRVTIGNRINIGRIPNNRPGTIYGCVVGVDAVIKVAVILPPDCRNVIPGDCDLRFLRILVGNIINQLDIVPDCAVVG